MRFFHSLSNRTPAWSQDRRLLVTCHSLALSGVEGSRVTAFLRYNDWLKLAQRNPKEAMA